MHRISELERIIKKNVGWHKSRVDCLVQLLLSLISVRTVNLRELALGMSDKSLLSSREKRIYRFFATFSFDVSCISKLILNVFSRNNKKMYIAIDRTNWYWGKKPINILMLSICYEGIAIPLLWDVLNKEGTCSGAEQIRLCKRFIMRFGASNIAGFLGDREFANRYFIGWLNDAKLPFYFRVKHDAQVYIGKKKYKKAKQLFPTLAPYEPHLFKMRVKMFGVMVYISGTRNERDEHMLVITNDNYQAAIPIYLRRWEIESLFQALKSRGFRFEDTHMTKPERIEKMIALLALGELAQTRSYKSS